MALYQLREIAEVVRRPIWTLKAVGLRKKMRHQALRIEDTALAKYIKIFCLCYFYVPEPLITLLLMVGKIFCTRFTDFQMTGLALRHDH